MGIVPTTSSFNFPSRQMPPCNNEGLVKYYNEIQRKNKRHWHLVALSARWASAGYIAPPPTKWLSSRSAWKPSEEKASSGRLSLDKDPAPALTRFGSTGTQPGRSRTIVLPKRGSCRTVRKCIRSCCRSRNLRPTPRCRNQVLSEDQSSSRSRCRLATPRAAPRSRPPWVNFQVIII